MSPNVETEEPGLPFDGRKRRGRRMGWGIEFTFRVFCVSLTLCSTGHLLPAAAAAAGPTRRLPSS